MGDIINDALLHKITIERDYPKEMCEKSYPDRYSASVFEKVNEIYTTELQDNYKKWKSGLNYKTKRKIKIGGIVHRKLSSDFHIYTGFGSFVLLEEIYNINTNEYLQETKKIKNEIDEYNNIVQKHNTCVRIKIEEIKKLQRWDNFVEFEGMCYGVPHILNKIHRRDNCFGELLIKSTETESYECRACNLGVFSNGCSCSRSTYYTYKCNKCDFTTTRSYIL